MSSSAILNKICRSSGLRVRPFVNAMGSQFVPILHTTIGVSCYLIYYIIKDFCANSRDLLRNQ